MGVPTTAVMLKKASSRSPRRYRNGTTTSAGPAPRIAARVTPQFLEQPGEPDIAGGRQLPPQPAQQVCPPLGQIDDVRRHPFWVQAQPEHVRRRGKQVRGDWLSQHPDRRIAIKKFPPAVDHHSGIGLVPGQHAAQGGADHGQFRAVERVLGVGRGVAAGQQQRVAVAQGDVEVLGQAQDHRAGRPGPAGLHKAQVACRDFGLDGQVKLAAPGAAGATRGAGHRRAGGAGSGYLRRSRLRA